jgi:hypothetical protein
MSFAGCQLAVFQGASDEHENEDD